MYAAVAVASAANQGVWPKHQGNCLQGLTRGSRARSASHLDLILTRLHRVGESSRQLCMANAGHEANSATTWHERRHRLLLHVWDALEQECASHFLSCLAGGASTFPLHRPSLLGHGTAASDIERTTPVRPQVLDTCRRTLSTEIVRHAGRLISQRVGTSEGHRVRETDGEARLN